VSLLGGRLLGGQLAGRLTSGARLLAADLARTLAETGEFDRPILLPERGPSGPRLPLPTRVYVDRDTWIIRTDLDHTGNTRSFVAATHRIPDGLEGLPKLYAVTGTAVAHGSAGATRTALAQAQAQADADADADAQADADSQTRRAATRESNEV
jgi:hypothetical protein